MDYSQTFSRLLGLVTALLLVGSASNAYAAASLDQLMTIDNLIGQKNWGALWAFVISNPELTVGDDPLAVELRLFLKSMNVGNVDEFAARPFVADRDQGRY